MKEIINLVRILKDCPTGMELDCPLYESVVLDQIKEGYPFPIFIKSTQDGAFTSLNKYGCFTNDKSAKCVIFPKGKNSWEGFVPPYRFNNGDVLATDLVYFIFKSKDDRDCYMHCNYSVISNNFSTSDTETVDSMYVHPATKEQRDILFQKMKESGYEWDAEKKELKKIEQKPAWSEEVEKMLEIITSVLQVNFEPTERFSGVRRNMNIDLISWLKSLKDKCIWKPSESDILLLERIANGKSNPQDFQASLGGLIERLKKLREE